MYLISHREILKRAVETYGAQAQTLMVFEEMSELQKELCKHARGKDNREAIAEEIADVQIMLGQMMILHRCERLVEGYRSQKLERLTRRLEEAHDPDTQAGQRQDRSVI